MGLGVSYCKGNHYLSCLENKKITTLKPVYLVYFKYNRFNSPNKYKYQLVFNEININNYNNFDLIIKINCNLSFNIINATTYSSSYADPKQLEFNLVFLNKVKLTDVEILKSSAKYLNFFKQPEYLKLDDLVYVNHSFFNHFEEFDINKMFSNVLDNAYINPNLLITDKEKLDFIAVKYKNIYKVE